MSAVYTVGTISVTNGSDIVTGSGTAWVGVIQTGWQIKLPNGEIYWVRQVNSATQLQLENAYTGTSQSNQDYIAGPTGGIARALANKVQDLIGDFQSVVDNAGDGKFADGDLAQPGIRFIADEDTGFRRPSSNTLDVVTGGVQRARFSSLGMNLSGLLSGTAVTQTATDTTDGRLMRVGAGGLLLGPGGANSLSDFRDANVSGVYRTTGSTANVPAGTSGSWGVWSARGGSTTAGVIMFDGSTLHTARLTDAGAVSDVETYYNTGNLPVTEGFTDVTGGRLTNTSWMGLGETALSTGFSEALFNNDANTIVRAQGRFTMRGNVVSNLPEFPNAPLGVLEQRLYNANPGFERIYQTYYRMNDWIAGRFGIFVRYYLFSEGWSPWVRMVDQSSIVGTVAQSAGVPTGAIIERGSNANGEFVRYADGTQMCWQQSQYNGLSQSVSNSNFPVNFINTDEVSASFSLGNASSADDVKIARVMSVSVTGQKWTVRKINISGESYDDMDVPIRLFAIGRWV